MPVLKAKLSDFTGSKEIAAGGEGKIYEHPHDKNKVVKIYHKTRKPEFVKHLEAISKLPSLFFIVPKDIYIDAKGSVIGYDMDYVNFNKYHLFSNLFNKGFCSTNGITKDMKMDLLLKMATWLKEVHKKGVVIGDLNQYNIFFALDGTFLFVDTDSYQTANNPHSGVLLDDIRDWTTTDINDKTDIWAYDILAFWATTYCHPYKWVVPGNKESIDVRVRGNKHILIKIPNVKIPPLYEAPTGKVYDQFMDIFSGRRYLVDFSGATYAATSTVVKQQILSQSINIKELFNNVLDIHVCENYFSIKIKSKEWLLIDSQIQKTVRTVKSFNCDELYPSDSGNFIQRMGDTIYGVDQSLSLGTKKFSQPVFYFNDGFLCVIEYPIDLQWNYNINNQMYGIDNTNTPVFAKSIIKRDGLLQNFGSEIYLNVPMYNSYSMVKLPKGTKNAYFNNGYAAVEFRDKNTVNYGVLDTRNSNKANNLLYLDYYSYFTATGSGTVFVPEDGYIDVYSSKLQFLQRFDCSVCTRGSKLFNTKAGLILYEDKTIYLLNTK